MTPAEFKTKTGLGMKLGDLTEAQADYVIGFLEVEQELARNPVEAADCPNRDFLAGKAAMVGDLLEKLEALRAGEGWMPFDQLAAEGRQQRAAESS